MMTTSNLTIRIDEDLKNQAKIILDGYGISPSQAVKMLFLELVATRKFPLNLNYQATMPNAQTITAMRELDSGGGMLYTNLDELLAEHGHATSQNQ